ncbi:MAG TPA: hypothetical protein VFE98_11410 [Candidatus Bathyarchaeia archaeon]|nr:hypothetical protein [Candidatus Bathyarchaeia archaeon]
MSQSSPSVEPSFAEKLGGISIVLMALAAAVLFFLVAPDSTGSPVVLLPAGILTVPGVILFSLYVGLRKRKGPSL